MKPVFWVRHPTGNNMLLENDKIMVSYNPIAGAAVGKGKEREIGKALQAIGAFFTDEGDPQEETALHDKRPNGKWYILHGDFRKEYEEAFPDFEKCLKVYQKNIQHRSEWSTDLL